MDKRKKTKIITSTAAIICLSAAIFLFVIARAYSSINEKVETKELTKEQKEYLQHVLNTSYQENNPAFLSPLPYRIKDSSLDISAKSAILFDQATGSILYRKNCCEKIPPASLTKIVEMYVVLDQVKKGNFNLDDKVPLPEESWAQNLPYDASRMGLTAYQTVTLRDLLTGLAVISGNDASIAVAKYIGGSMENFVKEMNKAVKDAGLSVTHFVESSGYSEENITTAEEFASFARLYIDSFPEALKEFHAKEVFYFPNDTANPFRLENTNKLLKSLKGCDGLKTGFIEESGYNICVTAKRNNVRFVSVTLGGPGSSTAEGNEGRVKDNTALIEFAFRNFSDYDADHRFQVKIIGAQEKSFYAIPALSEKLTVPFTSGISPEDSVKKIKTFAIIPSYVKESIEAGSQVGTIKYLLDDKILREIPLVADRSIKKGNFFECKWSSIQSLLIPSKIIKVEE